MSWLKRTILDGPNEVMEQEQVFFQLRQAQNAAQEMGSLLHQVSAQQGGQLDTGQLEQVQQLNARIGQFLQALRERIENEMQ